MNRLTRNALPMALAIACCFAQADSYNDADGCHGYLRASAMGRVFRVKRFIFVS